jgi:hypothetical protein
MKEGRLMPMPEYRCVRDACGWQGDEPDWEEEGDEDTSPGIPICPRCEGEVEERIHPGDLHRGLAAYGEPRDPIEEQRQALRDYLDAAVTWRGDHCLQVGLKEASLRTVLAGLAGDTALVPSWLCDDLGLIYGMTYGGFVAWIKDRLA